MLRLFCCVGVVVVYIIVVVLIYAAVQKGLVVINKSLFDIPWSHYIHYITVIVVVVVVVAVDDVVVNVNHVALLDDANHIVGV